jgi:hypothetical protein
MALFWFVFQVLHATVIKQMQMAETLEAVKESDLRVSVTYHAVVITLYTSSSNRT